MFQPLHCLGPDVDFLPISPEVASAFAERFLNVFYH